MPVLLDCLKLDWPCKHYACLYYIYLEFQGLKVSVEKAQNQLEEKKRLRKLCMFHILGCDHGNSNDQLNKVCVSL